MSPFYANYGYNPTVYNLLIAGQGTAQEAILQGDKLKQLYKELLADILFIIQRLAIYYDKKRSVGLTLKEGDKVYLL